MTVHPGHEKAVFGCDECIRVAGPGESVDGDWFCVEVFRSSISVFYLQAANIKDAREIANDVDLDNDFFDGDDDDVVVSIMKGPPEKGQPVLTDEGWESA